MTPMYAYAYPRRFSAVYYDASVNSYMYPHDIAPDDEAPYVPDDYVYDMPAWQDDMVTTRLLGSREEGLDIRGEVPEVTSEFGSAYTLVNEHIQNAIFALIDDARRVRARSITFQYRVYDTGNLVSIVVLSTVASVTSRTSVLSINFDPNTGRMMSLTDAIDLDITPLTEQILTDKIRRNPESYYAALTAPLEGQAFFLSDYSRLHLLFDEFQLSSIPGGIYSIVLELDNIKLVTISHDDYWIKLDGYNLKMIPLRYICQQLGYDVIWNSVSRLAEVWRRGQLLIEIEPDVNTYIIHGLQQQRRSLEAAPEIKRGVLYVPVTFFDQILSLTTYTIDDQGNITFLAYSNFS